MNDLNVGDRIRIISDPKFIEFAGEKSIIGMTGIVKDLDETCAGVEFDVYMGDHNGRWKVKNGYCWYIPYERLEKIEETEEETKEEVNKEVRKQEKEERKFAETGMKECPACGTYFKAKSNSVIFCEHCKYLSYERRNALMLARKKQMR